jgi:hypothetical protein
MNNNENNNNVKKIDNKKMEKFKNLSYLKALSMENLFVALPAAIASSFVNNVLVFFWMTISVGTLLGFVNLVILFVVVLNSKKYRTMKTKLNDKEVINELGELEAEYGDIGDELNSAAEGFIRLFKVSLFFLFFWSIIMKYSFDYLGNVTALGNIAIYIPFVYWLVYTVISSMLKKAKKEK